VVIALVDIYSGKRTVKNLASDVDSKVKEYQGAFNKLKLELQGHAVILTEITVLRVLDIVGDLSESSDLRPFLGLIHLATRWGSSAQ
jgi:hypothetical protein